MYCQMLITSVVQVRRTGYHRSETKVQYHAIVASVHVQLMCIDIELVELIEPLAAARS